MIEQGSAAKGLRLDVKALTDAIFARLGMNRTSLQWRADFRPNLADGWNDKGEPQEHDERSNEGRGFYKGGHDGQTANTLVCLERGERCVLILANDVRAEARFADLVRFVLVDSGVPYDWEYGDQAGKS